MKKLLFLMMISMILTLAGCDRNDSRPTHPPGVDPNDPWQRYPDGTPGVIDMRL